MTLLEELQWRGLLFQKTPDLEELIQKSQTLYIGFDPTATSLTIGNLVPIIVLMHVQRHGHQVIALVGGATGMIGDPGGKKAEREFLSMEQLKINQECIKKELMRFLDFSEANKPALMVNNFDWFQNMGVLEFLREAGKHLTISYMIAKDSVQSRLETGISYTEFSYQLIQGWDFYHLYKEHDCKIQLGGQDQWGNMTAGMELIRRKLGATDAHVATFPLVTKKDGTKFGKSEGGAVWLNAELTSAYKFYQFWINQDDDDALKFIKIYSFLNQEEIESIAAEHSKNPGYRFLQKRLAEEVTKLVHGEDGLLKAQQTTQLLFKGTKQEIFSLSEKEINDIFDGVNQFEISKEDLKQGIDIVSFAGEKTKIFPSKGEARKNMPSGSLSINMEKITDLETQINLQNLIHDRYIIARKGKGNYFLITAV